MRSVTFLIILNSCWLFGEKLTSACCLKMVFIDSESYFCCMQNSSMMRRDLNQGHFTIEVSWKKQNMIPFLCQTLVGLVYFIFIMVNGNFEVEPVVPIMRYLFFTNTREISLIIPCGGVTLIQVIPVICPSITILLTIRLIVFLEIVLHEVQTLIVQK